MRLSRNKALLSVPYRAFTLMGAFVLLSQFYSVLEAFAGGSYPAWTDSNQYVECGQDCLYQKANENVTAQSLYLVKKMENLQDVLIGGDFGNTDNYTHLVRELQLYCPDTDASKATKDQASLCYKRYVQTQIPILRALKATLVKNEDMTARLKTDQGMFGSGAGKSAAFQDATPGVRKAQTPEFSREDELLTTKAGQERLSYLSNTAYQKWAAEVSKLSPKQEDFPKTELVIKDPNDPTSMKVSRIIRDKYGVPVPDMNAFSKADAEFKKNVLGVDPKGDLNMARVAASSKKAKSSVGAVDNLNTWAVGQKGQGLKPTVSQLDETSYHQARNLAVESEAKLFARGVMRTKEFPGAPRKPASTKDKTATPPVPGAPGSQAANTDSSLGTASSYSYDQIVKAVPEATARPIPAGNTNAVYSVTLSPDELETRIEAFQKHADSL